ncbi:hypothetical protein BCR34DRAFT_37041 [Clohesyomyces aquaticus]|uniref:Uncharacterized protein n=1 Tax=Clohesyomyces aquaticus TaxID=1231657 RepID=A0A1Y2A4F4_9PLEO|nr:hypothetical protein BCR34DRAFT_37041 [Clohesyomyces aquaticus]
MLPLEILTLVLLATAATATPQRQNGTPTNETSPIVTNLPDTPDAPEFVHQESTATGFGGGPMNGDPKKIHWESTADGFDHTTENAHEEPPSPTPIITTEYKPSNVLSTAAIIHTEIRVSISRLDPTNAPVSPSNTPNLNGDNGGTTGGKNGNPEGGSDPTAPTGNAASQQPTPGGQLLDEIISKLGPGNPEESHNTAPNGGQQNIPGAKNTDLAAATGSPVTAAPELTLAQAITLGSATLTLTPGLTTAVGTGSSLTSVELTTNYLGQTIIVISSSGTAVSATITSGPVTATSARTGFDAATTAKSSLEPTIGAFGTGGAAATTPKKGDAAGLRTRKCELGMDLALSVFALMLIV